MGQGVGDEAGQDTPAITVVEAARWHSEGADLIDVREPEEYAAVHIEGARLLPMGQVPAQLGRLPTDRPIVVVCRSGRRSGEITRLLLQAGFRRAVNMTGGMIAWQEAGLPVAP